MIDPETMHDVLRLMSGGIDKSLEDTFGERLGFMLVVFEFYKEGQSYYISNSKREDMIKTLRETADRLEKREDNVVRKITIQ